MICFLCKCDIKWQTFCDTHKCNYDPPHIIASTKTGEYQSDILQLFNLATDSWKVSVWNFIHEKTQTCFSKRLSQRNLKSQHHKLEIFVMIFVIVVFHSLQKRYKCWRMMNTVLPIRLKKMLISCSGSLSLQFFLSYTLTKICASGNRHCLHLNSQYIFGRSGSYCFYNFFWSVKL